MREDIVVRHNLRIRLTERGKYVPGSFREGHNVFTATGRDWLSRLCAWQTVGSPDVPFTNRRVRWMGVGTGTQLEVSGVVSLVTPAPIASGIYLGAVQAAEFPATQRVRFFKEFSESEITYAPAMIVPITEAGMFVDVYPVSTGGGTDDAGIMPYDTTLNPSVVYNSPVAYKTFQVINKTVDFKLELQWDLIFG